jgi:hypothetical protein
MLSRRFINARIDKINENAFVLKIVWNWFFVVDYEEVHVFSTLDEAKSKFLEIRADCRLHAKDETGNPLKL